MSEFAVLEANLVRLLHCTESLGSLNNLSTAEYRTNYRKLRSMLHSLSNGILKPAAEFLHVYKRRVFVSFSLCLFQCILGK